ncbi:protein ripply2-like [Sceloporus undulatus]|uniref:protein ripply2-like n=1 Tax=Sceloporus undulatus TaxID=8520 RepID=UPI001C4B682D|nr:protein ripply2-like [Sceloporus undulatus]XP_042299368.1 protein ripply2-like [Sceloporus undulatus]
MERTLLCLHSSPPPGSRSSKEEQPGSARFWRPWIPSQKEAEKERTQKPQTLCDSFETTEDSAKLTQYTHPVRLFWPKSRCFDYLYHEAEALLRNFPVQATISFYEESESEEETDELEHDSGAEVDY